MTTAKKTIVPATAYAIDLVNKSIKGIKTTLDKLPAQIQFAITGGLYQWAMHGNTNPLNDLLNVLKSGQAKRVTRYVLAIAALQETEEKGVAFAFVKGTSTGEKLATETLAKVQAAGRWDTWQDAAAPVKFVDFDKLLTSLIDTDIKKFDPAQHDKVMAVRALLATFNEEAEETEATALPPATIVTGDNINAEALAMAQALSDAEEKKETEAKAKRETSRKTSKQADAVPAMA